MAVWLGQTPAGNGWRYMHEDGRVEDVDPTAIGMPPGWAPPGFEADPGQTGYAGNEAPPAEAAPPDLAPPTEPGLGVAPLEAPQVEPPPQPSAPVAPGPGSSSTAQSSSWRGATLGINGSPAASDKLSRRADAEARRQTALYQPAFQAQADAVTGMAQSQAAMSEAQAQGLEKEGALLRDQAEGRQREVMEIDAKSQKWTADLREAIESIPTMDSKRVFKNQTNRESAGMAMAAFMGGFLQPVLGTNTPMDIINKAIDRDIAEQQNDQEQAQRKVWNLKDLASRDMDAATWQLNQKDVMRLSSLTALQRDAQAKVQGYQSDVFKKQGEKLIADLEKSRVDTYQNIYTNTRNFMEQQRHSMRMESIQSQELAFKKAQAQAAAKAAATEKRTANFLHGDTGIRAKGPNAHESGWVAPNEKIREEAARKFEGGKDQWIAAHTLKKLSTGGHFGMPGSETRKRASAAAVRMSFDLMSRLQGLGQKEDTARMMQAFGGDPDKFFRLESEETIKKVLADYQDGVQSNMKTYTKSLQYDPNDSLDWAPPAIPDEKKDTGTRFGDSGLDLEAALKGDPEISVQESIKGMLDEVKSYPGAINDPEARNRMDRNIQLLESMPREQRMLALNPGGEAEATQAKHSGRSDLDRPIFGDGAVDPLDILKSFRESPPTAVEGYDDAERAKRNAGLGEGYRQFQKTLNGGR